MKMKLNVNIENKAVITRKSWYKKRGLEKYMRIELRVIRANTKSGSTRKSWYKHEGWRIHENRVTC